MGKIKDLQKGVLQSSATVEGEMGRHVRLFQRGGRWTFRVWVPDELRPIIGKREVWKSLGAVPHKEAVRLLHIECAKTDALFAAAREKLGAGVTGGAVTDADLHHLARAYLHRLEISAPPMPFSEADRLYRRDAAEEDAHLIGQSIEDPSLTAVAKEVAREGNLPSQLAGATLLKLVEAVQRATIEHLGREADRAELVPEKTRDALFSGITKDSPAPVGRTKLKLGAIIDAQAAKRAAGEGAKPMPQKSIDKYRRIAGVFAKFRGSDDATTITVAEVEDWRDNMLAAGEPGNRTIADRLVSLATIVEWGKSNRLHREAMRSAEKLAGVVEAPSYVEKSADETSYTVAEAVTLLAATRRLAASKDKVHNLYSKRWLPWLCAYGGLRIAEAEQLRREDFFQVDGNWFFRVTTAGRRSLKTRASQRVIPLHPAIAEEGFISWLEGQSEGQLFASSASSYMGRWVRSTEVGITREGVSPNHGLRHLLKGLAMRDGVGDEAREYLMGHASTEVHRKYGATDVMLPGLAAEMRKIRALKVP